MGKKKCVDEQPLLFDFGDESASVGDTVTADDAPAAETELPVAEAEPLVAEAEHSVAEARQLMPEASVPVVVTEEAVADVAEAEEHATEADEQPKAKRKKFRGRPMKRQKVKEVLPQGMPSYLSVLNPAKAEQLAKEIFKVVVLEKRFLDPKLTARDLAHQLHTNTRYLSITMNRRFHCNFSTFVSRLRVEEAMTRMCDSRYDEVPLQDIASFVGFASRQSFITAFQKINGVTPSAYRASLHFSKRVDK